MKKTLLSIAFAALASHGADAGEIRLEDCPAAVKATINDNAAQGTLDEVERYSIDGKVIYIAEFDLPGKLDLKLYLSGDGKLLKTRTEIPLKDAPEAVRQAIAKLEGTLDDVERVTEGKKVTYLVEMDRGGKADLHVSLSPEGAVVSQREEVND